MTTAWKKFLLIGLAVFLFSCTLLFNSGVRQTFLRIGDIKNAERELELVSSQVDAVRAKLDELEASKSGREELVRRDLGYLRPGERELRFLDKKS